MVKRFLGSARRYMLNLAENPAVVLLYHRVTSLENDPQLLSVTPANFYEQLTHLRKKYHVMAVEDFYDIFFRRKKFPPRSVLLTFDDGYADNYLEALPILENLDMQALFFITTSNLDTDRELWWDELERIFLGDNPLPNTIEIEVADGHVQLDTRTKTGRRSTYDFLHPLLRFTPPLQRDQILDHLRSLAGLNATGRPTHRMMTSDELRKMSQSASAVIGAHTHNHPSMAVLPYNEQFLEITKSKAVLEQITGKAPKYFSYPYGSKQDYNKDSVNACREAGFLMACSNYYNQVHSWTDPFQVPRILVRNWDNDDFKSHLSKFFSY
jgi:peptidoglycan/xylan/chitin deacetylase (PgdA/CDA1 family)